MADHRLHARGELRRRHWPRFVTFTDFSDPTSVVQVTQGNIDDLFGAGVTIKDVTIEMTDEAVTEKIQNYAPSFNEVKRPISLGAPNNQITYDLLKR